MQAGNVQIINIAFELSQIFFMSSLFSLYLRSGNDDIFMFLLGVPY